MTNIQNGANEIDNMLNSSKFGTSVNLANNASNLINRNNTTDIKAKDIKLDTQIDKPKTPVILQLMLSNGRSIAEYIVDDLDELLGGNNKLYERSVGVR